VPLVLDAGRAVRANLSLDAGHLDAIDEAAKAHGPTRSAFLASAAREKIEGHKESQGMPIDTLSARTFRGRHTSKRRA
jgi:metal-responsive CopG/Arc/MetJ family transcriptional regulator